MSKVEPSTEVQKMESMAAVRTVTEMCAEFYNSLRGRGLPDQVAWGLTNTWLASMIGSAVAGSAVEAMKKHLTGEEGEDDE